MIKNNGCKCCIVHDPDPTADVRDLATLQTKNTGNLPVHSQNVRVYGEVTGISRVYGWVTGFFLYYLSCSFVYHAKF
jgi:hypothetical protein